MAAFNPLEILHRLRQANVAGNANSAPALQLEPSATMNQVTINLNRTRSVMGSPGIGDGLELNKSHQQSVVAHTNKTTSDDNEKSLDMDERNDDGNDVIGMNSSRSQSPVSESAPGVGDGPGSSTIRKKLLTMASADQILPRNIREQLESELELLKSQIPPLRRENKRLQEERDAALEKLQLVQAKNADVVRGLRGQLSSLQKQYSDLAAGRVSASGTPSTIYTNGRPLSEGRSRANVSRSPGRSQVCTSCMCVCRCSTLSVNAY